MLNNFIISLEAVLPMFIIMGVGMLVKRLDILNDSEIKRLNHMVFVVFFSVMMFDNIYGSDVSEAIKPELIAFGIIMVMAVYFVTLAIILVIEKSPQSRGAMIQAIYRSNFVILGIPIAVNMFGRGNLGVTAVMVAIIVPLYNVLAVITLEVFRGGKPNFANVMKNLIKNPLILGAMAGIVAVLLHIQLPTVLETVTSDMGAVATPMALVVLGASFNLNSVKSNKRNLIICVVSRLIIVPAIALTAAMFMGFRGIEFVTLIAIFAAPTAVSSFTMAESMGSDGQLAGSAVIFSSAFACCTMFLWIFLFKSLGMF